MAVQQNTQSSAQKWSAEEHIEMMKQLNIRKTVLSMSSPGTHLTPGNNKEARSLTRKVNEDMAKICVENSGHFMFFASLPLPDVEGSLDEIDYALDHLGAVGFQILTNSHGIYPGDVKFLRIFDKLSERQAVVFLHPTTCHIRNAGSITPVVPVPSVPSPVMEFMFETTRSLTSLFTSGTVERCPGITFVVCHCGATFPPTLERIGEFSQFLVADGKPFTGDQVKEQLQSRFYFDLAGVPFPDQIHGLLRLVDSSRLLYGSDYPYTPVSLAVDLARRLDRGLDADLGPTVQEQVLLRNAERLLGLRG